MTNHKTFSLICVTLLTLCSGAFAQTNDPYATKRADWLAKAEAAKPKLIEKMLRPVAVVEPREDATTYQGWRMERVGDVAPIFEQSFKKVGRVTFDFGCHMTGYLSFTLSTIYRVQDAPIRLKLTLGEVPAEMATPFDPWRGDLSRGWMQDETVTLMHIDTPVTLERRLAGRYLTIELLGAPRDFDFALTDVCFKAVSSVDAATVATPEGLSDEMTAIFRTGVNTLAECMQTVYEDGPKRDARLWIGDLYLESIANGRSFECFDLTKRCLYLLAGLSGEDGILYANCFEKPLPHAQIGSYCLSYNLLFNHTLLEYLERSGDRATAEDLWEVARRQMDDALSFVDERCVFDRNRRGEFVWLFFDWRDGYEESISMQGLVIEALDRTYALAERLGRASEVASYPAIAKKMRAAARKYLYNKPLGLFVNETSDKPSILSQVWMVLSGVVSPKEGAALLRRAASYDGIIKPGSPYGNHYYLEAMVRCGMADEARTFISNYWGGMVRKGADTFWEVYDPDDDYLSPYNFYPLNSYCHAWSCTPVYFIKEYPEIFGR